MKKNIYVIVLHFGKLNTTKNCVTSLEKIENFPHKTIVINNTQEILNAKDFSPKIKIINNKTNKGFAGGVNAGIKYVLSKKADAILILNNDVKVEKPFLKSLINILFSKKDRGIVGPAIKFIKNNKTVYDIGGNVTWFGKTYHNEPKTLAGQMPQEITYMTGAAMLVKKDVFGKIGFFDESFFLYYEDVDFCLRAKKKGFKVFIDPSVYITHSLSKTAGKMSPNAVYHQTRSALIFEKKHMKNILQKGIHRLFILVQTILFTLEQPKSGFAAWKAILFYK